jgi:hypothetical protein
MKRVMKNETCVMDINYQRNFLEEILGLCLKFSKRFLDFFFEKYDKFF